MDLANISKISDKIDSKSLGVGLVFLVLLAVAVSQAGLSETGLSGDQISVDVSVDTGNDTYSESVEVANGTTVLSVVNSTYDVDYQKSAQGYYITGIEGVSSTSDMFWIYFVNGESPSVGVGQYRITEDTNVTFRYMSGDEAMKHTG